MRKHVALIAVFLLIFVTTAGCIDIWLVKDTLVPHEEEIVEYWDNTFNLVNKTFTSQFDPDNLVAIEEFDEDFILTVKPGSKNLRISIDVGMESLDEYLEYLNGTPFGELIGQLSEAVGQRYAEITIKMPDGTVWGETHAFTDTDDEEIYILGDVAEGDWTVEVEGAGVGGEVQQFEFEYHDSIVIDVIIKEIKE